MTAAAATVRRSLFGRPLGEVIAVVVVVAVTGMVTTWMFTFAYSGSGGWQFDLGVYRQGAEALLRGASLYEGGHFTYPPFAAIVLAPLAILDEAVVVPLWIFSSVVAVVIAVVRLQGCLPGRKSSALAGAVFASLLAFVLCWSDPGRTSLMLGQVTCFLLAVMCWEATAAPTSRWQGVALGLAAGVKILPAVLIVFYLLTGRTKAAARASLTFAGTVVVSLAIAPADTLSYWSGLLFDTSRVGVPRDVYSESFVSIVVRWSGSAAAGAWWGLAMAGAFTVAAFMVAKRLWDLEEPLPALSAALIVMAVAPPVAWTFYWLWPLVPLAVWLVDRVRRARSAAAAVVLVVLVALFGPNPNNAAADKRRSGDLDQGELVLTSLHLALALALLVVLGMRLRSPNGHEASSVSPADRKYG